MAEEPEHEIIEPRLIISMSLRWIARALSLLLIVYIFLSIVGEPEAMVRGFDTGAGLTVISLIVMGFGMVIAWFRGEVGGVVILFGYLLIIIGQGRLIVNWAHALLPLTGLMFLVSTILDKGKPNKLRF